MMYRWMVGKAAFGALLLAGALFGCRPELRSAETVTGVVDAQGGSLTLSDGSHARFEAGFLRAPAQVALAGTSPPVGESAAGAMRPVGHGLSLRIPYDAILTTGPYEERQHLSLHLAALPEDFKDAAELLVEVRIRLPDESEFSYYETRRPSPSGAASGDEGSNVIRLNNRQLISLGPSVLSDVVITVQTLAAARLATQALPSGFVLEEVVAGLNQSVAFDFAPDGRVFIGEKGGVVRVFRDGALIPTPFIDISAQVNALHDRGMLGLAVHPAFPAEPYVYLLFTYDPPETAGRSGYAGPDGAGARVSRLIRVTADAAKNHNAALPGSEVVLLGTNSTWANIGNPAARNGAPSCESGGGYVQDCLPADEWSHTIGAVRFGSDGSLLVSNGDGANYTAVQTYAVRALELGSLAGKLLRIDPMTGKGLPNNPFYDGDPDSNRAKVYSLGLRNPFRFAVRATGSEPFIGDVGWNTWEEIDAGRGASFGWPCYEGGSGTNNQQGAYRALAYCQTLYEDVSAGRKRVTPATYAYDRTDGGGGSSVQAGSFYSGTSYPGEYRNALFIFDYNRQWVRYLTFDKQGRFKAVRGFASGLEGVVQISSGPGGDLYLLSIYPAKFMRLRYAAANQPPVAAASAAPMQGPAPLEVAFSSGGSSDPDGDALSYAWAFGDGGMSAQPNPAHSYRDPGIYSAVLTVTDTLGATGSSSVQILVDNTRPTATITAPTPGTRFEVGDLVAFSGSGSDPADLLSWELTLHHAQHQHFDGLPANTTGDSGSFKAPDHGDDTRMELCLSAKNSAGLSDRACVVLEFSSVFYTLDTVPTGLELPWEGVARQTPFTVETYVGASKMLVAPATQGTHTFQSWSDGGAREHGIAVGNQDTTLTATYLNTFTLEATNAAQRVTLTWSGAPAGQLDVFRNGSRVARNIRSNADGTGSYADTLRQRGTYTYQVCQVRTSVCSSTAQVSY